MIENQIVPAEAGRIAAVIDDDRIAGAGAAAALADRSGPRGLFRACSPGFRVFFQQRDVPVDRRIKYVLTSPDDHSTSFG